MYSQIKRPFIFLFVLVALMMVISACNEEDFRTGAYKTLSVSASLYEEGFKAFKTMHDDNLISDDAYIRGRNYALKFWGAYHVAEKALNIYEETKTADAKQAVIDAMANVIAGRDDLMKFLDPFIHQKKEVIPDV